MFSHLAWALRVYKFLRHSLPILFESYFYMFSKCLCQGVLFAVCGIESRYRRMKSIEKVEHV